ncbi:serine protease Do [Clostridium pascui]|uniref:S1C family serine protease n=1 Tax=Clostridium pascui TaxID=46609 RepID=UPI0019563AAB|nr:trypsin-like peptidase domain-containing protein [Clostridium pascui]MBM7871258.1 serine protease Do [Clostridium pascui]
MADLYFSDNHFNKTHKKRRRKFIFLLSLALVISSLAFFTFSCSPNLLSNNKNNDNNISAQQPPSSSTNPPNFAEPKEALSIPEVVKKVSPAVVSVSTKSIVRQWGRDFGVQEGIGSGFIINNEGYILTNYHVISGAQEVRIIFNDSKVVNAKIINYDSVQDIAVVKVDGNIKVPGVVELGDSDKVEVGESVVAIGNPLGKEFIGTVTRGIISAINRGVEVEKGRTQSFLQTDAAINPGNSGGPLINTLGQVIGINTAKITEQGVEGIGFSIPINTVKQRLTALTKPVLRIGIGAIGITNEISKSEGIPTGVYVKEVYPESPASKAGIAVNDLITKFDGKTVTSIEEINSIKATHKAGDVIKVEIFRNKKNITANLTLIE